MFLLIIDNPSLDVDATFLHGHGFPRHRGGPMTYADTVGLPKILADIRSFAQEDPLFWKASLLLERQGGGQGIREPEPTLNPRRHSHA